MKTIINSMMAIALLVSGTLLLNSCDPEEPALPNATFQYEVSETDFLEVTFNNFSSNATSYAWDFGDGNTSTDENPVHMYAAAGTYTVELVASDNAGNDDAFSTDVTITDPNEALTLLAGLDSKDWKLTRETQSLYVGPSAESKGSYFTLENNGLRPCLFDDVFTFHRDGTFTYDDGGTFWGEYGIWGTNNTENQLFETCFTPDATTMNINGNDVTAWGTGSHTFTYDATAGELTLNGTGAWMVIPNSGTTAPHGVDAFPTSKTMAINIVEKDGYDSMTVTFDYGNDAEGGAGFRQAIYISYDDWTMEPDIVSCELDDAAPSLIEHTFESASSFTLLGTVGGGSPITFGVADPDGGTAVGKLERVAVQFQEAQLRLDPLTDIDFANLTTLSIDVYVPSTNNFSGSLLNRLEIGFADQSCINQWWTDLYQYTTENIATDTWVTLSYNLDTPTFAASGDNPKTRAVSLDMLYLNFGGGNHFDTGEILIRNLVIE